MQLAPPASVIAAAVESYGNPCRATHDAAPSESRLPKIGAPESGPALDDSDVFVCAKDDSSKPSLREVTLFVHQWHNVEPGLLSWTFPSLRAALDAVQRMKNAIGWCVVSGTGFPDLESARADGAVLVEQLS